MNGHHQARSKLPERAKRAVIHNSLVVSGLLVVLSQVGCLGDRYEAGIPPAYARGAPDDGDRTAGPRTDDRLSASGTTLPRSRTTLPQRRFGTLPNRTSSHMTLPSRRGPNTLPRRGVTTLPKRSQ